MDQEKIHAWFKAYVEALKGCASPEAAATVTVIVVGASAAVFFATALLNSVLR